MSRRSSALISVLSTSAECECFHFVVSKHMCFFSSWSCHPRDNLGLQVTENGHIRMWKLDGQDVKPHGSCSGRKVIKAMDLIIHDRRIWLKMGMLAAVSCLRRIPKSPLLQMVLERGHGLN